MVLAIIFCCLGIYYLTDTIDNWEGKPFGYLIIDKINITVISLTMLFFANLFVMKGSFSGTEDEQLIALCNSVSLIIYIIRMIYLIIFKNHTGYVLVFNDPIFGTSFRHYYLPKQLNKITAELKKAGIFYKVYKPSRYIPKKDYADVFIDKFYKEKYFA